MYILTPASGEAAKALLTAESTTLLTIGESIAFTSTIYNIIYTI